MPGMQSTAAQGCMRQLNTVLFDGHSASGRAGRTVTGTGAGLRQMVPQRMLGPQLSGRPQTSPSQHSPSALQKPSCIEVKVRVVQRFNANVHSCLLYLKLAAAYAHITYSVVSGQCICLSALWGHAAVDNLPRVRTCT